MKNLLITTLCLAGLVVKAQVNWTTNPLNVSSGINARIGTENKRSLHFFVDNQRKMLLDSTGLLQLEQTMLIKKQLALGTQTDNLSIFYTPASEGTPGILRFSVKNNVEVPSGDPPPNLLCTDGALNMANTFQNSIIAEKLIGSAGGNILLGHSSTKAFIESQGTGTGANNHRGDLFINQNCGRNVFVFNGSALGFANGQNNVMSIGGKLNITDNVQISSSSFTNFKYSDTRLYVYSPPTTPVGIKVRHGGGGQVGIKVIELSDNDTALAVYRGSGLSDGARRFSVQGNGRTIIGAKTQASPSPHAGNALLTVYGKIVAQSCYITMLDWADYVFAPDYKLPALKEVEAFYKKNKHLPDVPAESEVISNGIELSEMNKLLLKKVEELTIYLVEHDKKIAQLSAQISELKASKP